MKHQPFEDKLSNSFVDDGGEVAHDLEASDKPAAKKVKKGRRGKKETGEIHKELASLRKELREKEAIKDTLHKQGMKVEQPERARIFEEAVPYCKAVSQLRGSILRIEKKLRDL